MNTYCQFMRGFTIRRVCGNHGSAVCRQCGLTVCSSHYTPTLLGTTICLGCSDDDSDTSTDDNDSSDNDADNEKFSEEEFDDNEEFDDGDEVTAFES